MHGDKPENSRDTEGPEAPRAGPALPGKEALHACSWAMARAAPTRAEARFFRTGPASASRPPGRSQRARIPKGEAVFPWGVPLPPSSVSSLKWDKGGRRAPQVGGGKRVFYVRCGVRGSRGARLSLSGTPASPTRPHGPQPPARWAQPTPRGRPRHPSVCGCSSRGEHGRGGGRRKSRAGRGERPAIRTDRRKSPRTWPGERGPPEGL